MGFYGERVLPRVIDRVCGSEDVAEQRERVVPLARGRVLEVGIGPGHNLAHYDREAVDWVWGLEPTPAMRKIAEPRIAESGLDVRWLESSGEEIPLDDDSVDSIVLTYTLCSIRNWRRALDQMHRVLAPDGRIVFTEHGAAPDDGVLAWQRRLNPVWRVVAGGCNLDRPIDRCLEAGGFAVDTLQTEYRGVPRATSFTYWGTAVPV